MPRRTRPKVRANKRAVAQAINRRTGPEAVQEPRRFKPPAKPRERKVTITLERVHSVNGINYHGTVTVGRGLADVLLEQERNAGREERAFNERDPLGTIILSKGRLHRVPGALFGDALNRVTPIII